MPALLRIAVLFDITDVSFGHGNFAKPIDPNFWNFPDYEDTVNDNFRGGLDPITQSFGSTVRLVPNNSTLVSFDYDLNRVYETLFINDGGEAEPGVRCIVFEFRLRD